VTVAIGTPHATTSIHVAAEALVFRAPGVGLELIAVPEVELRHGEVLAEIELATICGSDLHTLSGLRAGQAPLVLGHEQVGRVRALGPGRAARDVRGHELHVGDRIVWGVAIDCGRCRYCRLGLPQKCVSLRKYGHERLRRGWELSGGFASHAQLLARTVIVRVPEDLPSSLLAPASCATATVAAALEAAEAVRPIAGSVVAVSGAGMLGLTAIAMAREAGAVVVAADPDPGRRQQALAFGAVAVSDGTAAGLDAALRRVPAARHGFGVGFELSGAPSAVSTLLSHTDVGAAVVLVGSVYPVRPIDLDPEAVVRRMLTIRGVHNYGPRHLSRAVDFLAGAGDRYPFEELVGEVFPFARVADAVAAASQHSAVRVGLSRVGLSQRGG
jgi:putative phosphonate catabolism associated alcohol dehydrogenase